MAKNYFGTNSAKKMMSLVKTADAGKIDKASINNTLTSDATTEVLAAAQGKVLDGRITGLDSSKLNKTDVVNNLTTADTGKALDATQGKALDEKIDSTAALKVDKTSVADNLTTETDGSVLSAKQGKVLDGKISDAASKAASDLAAAKEELQGSIDEITTDLEGYATDEELSSGLATKINSNEKGAANGVATLDASGQVPSSQLPSYVDDVIEGYLYQSEFYEDSAHSDDKKITGESGKIYVDLSTNLSYRHGTSGYILITSSDMVEMTDQEVENLWNQTTVS